VRSFIHGVLRAAPAELNFIAHVDIARVLGASRGDDAVAFGAALPDLASMAGLRIDRSLLPGAVREGVDLHHRTDTAFHSLNEFRTGVRYLGELLRARGIALGPSRAVGHAGWELLLDGWLLERSVTVEGFESALAGAPDVAEAVSPLDPDRWRGLVASMRLEKWWLGYGDTEIVAQRLQRRLHARRRLAFAVVEIPLVADALAAAKPSVGLAADGVMAAVVSMLTAGASPAA
jgi:hypothetical protein